MTAYKAGRITRGVNQGEEEARSSAGSKNLKRSPEKMDLGELQAYVGRLQDLLSKKVTEQKAFFENQLAELTGYVSKKATAAYKAVGLDGRKSKRAKAKPKYQSRKNRSLKWSGRGMTPVWMREEMKGTRLKKDDVLISR